MKRGKLPIAKVMLHHAGLHINVFSSVTLFFIPLIAVLGVHKFLWITYINMKTTGEPPLTCSQQSAGVSSENNTGQNMSKDNK